MTNTELDSLITPNVIRETFEGNLLDSDNKGWYITVCGKVLTIKGKIFFNSREQAVKAFYNSYNWRATRNIAVNVHPNQEYRWWNDPNRPYYWKAFKRVLEKDYGLRFIRA